MKWSSQPYALAAYWSKKPLKRCFTRDTDILYRTELRVWSIWCGLLLDMAPQYLGRDRQLQNWSFWAVTDLGRVLLEGSFWGKFNSTVWAKEKNCFNNYENSEAGELRSYWSKVAHPYQEAWPVPGPQTGNRQHGIPVPVTACFCNPG